MTHGEPCLLWEMCIRCTGSPGIPTLVVTLWGALRDASVVGGWKVHAGVGVG